MLWENGCCDEIESGLVVVLLPSLNLRDKVVNPRG